MERNAVACNLFQERALDDRAKNATQSLIDLPDKEYCVATSSPTANTGGTALRALLTAIIFSIPDNSNRSPSLKIHKRDAAHLVHSCCLEDSWHPRPQIDNGWSQSIMYHSQTNTTAPPNSEARALVCCWFRSPTFTNTNCLN